MNIKYNQHLVDSDIPELYSIFEDKNRLNHTIKLDFNKFLSRIRSRENEFRNSYYENFTDNEERFFTKYVNEFSIFKSNSSTMLRDSQTQEVFNVRLSTMDSYFNNTLTFKAMEASVFTKIDFYPDELVSTSKQMVALAIINNKYAYIKYPYETEQLIEFLNKTRNITNSRDYRFIGFENIIPLEHLYIRMYHVNNFIAEYKYEVETAKKKKILQDLEFSSRIKEIADEQRRIENLGRDYSRTITLSTPSQSIQNPFLDFAERQRNYSQNPWEAWTLRTPIAEDLSEQFRQEYMVSSNELHTEQQVDRLRMQMQADHRFLAEEARRRSNINHIRSGTVNGARADTIIVDDIEF